MQTENIPREQWTNFLAGYAKQHQGWLASIEISDPRGAREVAVQDRPLDQIVAASAQERIAIVFGKPDGQQETKMIDRPSRIRSVETSDNKHVGLEIETAAGDIIALRFRSPMPPEIVDGIAA